MFMYLNNINSLLVNMFMKQSMKAHINSYRNINVLLALFQNVPKP